MKTPVVLLIFNRPDLTALTHQAIRAAQPEVLFVVSDGARQNRPGEESKVAEARAIAERVDWPCELVKVYSEQNLGCGRRVSSGLTCVFEQVKEAIVLEDDCLPDASFFSYCSVLLKRYETDPRIASISGDNFQPRTRRYPGSYYFSRYPHIWGWATWRRSWQSYDFDISQWPSLREAGWLKSICANDREAEYWQKAFDDVHAKKVDTWDYQWLFSCWLNDAFAILPRANLVSNIGFRHDATHTLPDAADWTSSRPTSPVSQPLKHPRRVEALRTADEYTFKRVYDRHRLQPRTLKFRIASIMRRLHRSLPTLLTDRRRTTSVE